MNVPLIVPPQSQAVLDGATPQRGPQTGGALFQRSWYLFFQELQQYASTAAGIVQYGTAQARTEFDIGALADGTLWVETDTGFVFQWRAVDLRWEQVVGSSAAATLFEEVAVTAPTTQAAPASSGPGQLLEMVFVQDGTGHVVTWGVGFKRAPKIPTTPNTLSAVQFVQRSDGNWWLASLPTLGMTT